MNTVLVVAVHPDDETLGCGGTILRHKEAGDKVHWLILTAMAEEYGYPEQEIQKRAGEIKKVANLYGFDGVDELNLPPANLDYIPLKDIISSVSEVLNRIRPNILYLPFQGDVHSDHRIAFEAAYGCTKTFRAPFLKRILMMEIISETEFAPATQSPAFVPNVFVDVTNFMDRKLEIMKAYSSEMDEHPFPRSERNIRALATFRGARAGCTYAESFMLLEELI